MTSPVIVALISVIASGILSMVGAMLLGKLVPSGHVTAVREEAEKRILAAEARAEKYQLAYETLRRSSDLLEETVKRQHVVGDTANMLIGMIRQTAAALPSSQSTQAGGPA